MTNDSTEEAMRIELLNNASSTGGGKTWNGGQGAFLVAGTLAGATVKLQVLGPDGVTWLDVGADAALAAPGAAGFALPPGQIRAEVSGGSAPTGLYAQAVSI
jgi:hypothetical protein